MAGAATRTYETALTQISTSVATKLSAAEFPRCPSKFCRLRVPDLALKSPLRRIVVGAMDLDRKLDSVLPGLLSPSASAQGRCRCLEDQLARNFRVNNSTSGRFSETV